MPANCWLSSSPIDLSKDYGAKLQIVVRVIRDREWIVPDWSIEIKLRHNGELLIPSWIVDGKLVQARDGRWDWGRRWSSKLGRSPKSDLLPR